jgi:hypothetical protein
MTRTLSTLPRLLAVLLLALVWLPACSDDGSSVADITDSSTSADGSADGSAAPDTAVDTATDTATDTAVDTAPDTAADTAARCTFRARARDRGSQTSTGTGQEGRNNSSAACLYQHCGSGHKASCARYTTGASEATGARTPARCARCAAGREPCHRACPAAALGEIRSGWSSPCRHTPCPSPPRSVVRARSRSGELGSYKHSSENLHL